MMVLWLVDMIAIGLQSLMVKFDILGLRTLSVVYDVCSQLKIGYRYYLTNDRRYINSSNIDQPQGLFQIEASHKL